MLKDGFLTLTHHSLFKKFFGLTILLYLSPIIGVLVDIMFIRRFGAGEVMDVYRVLIGFMLLGNGLFSAQLFKFVVIPKLAMYKAKGQNAEGLLFAHRFLIIIFALFAPVLAIGFFNPLMMLEFLAPGLSEAVTDKGFFLARIATFGFAVTTLVGALSAVLNFYGNFWGQPLGQIVLNAVILIGLLAFGQWAQTQGDQIAVVQYALLIGILLMGGISVYLYRDIQTQVGHAQHKDSFFASLLIILPLLLPQLILLASEMYKPILMNQTLSFAGAGAVALYQLAFRLLMLGGLPVQGLLAVLFPNMANNSKIDSAEIQYKTYIKTISALFLGTLGIVIMLWLLADIIIGLLSLVSDLDTGNEDLLLGIYRTLLYFSPFGAIGLYAIQAAYSNQLNLIVMANSILTVILLLTFLPQGEGIDPLDIVQIFVVIQSATFLLIAMIVLFILYKRIKTDPNISQE